MTNTAAVPRYYLVHETPNGLRFAYPKSLVELLQPSRSWPARDPQLSVSAPEGVAWTVSGEWLITDAPVEELRRVTPGSRVRDGWVKREELRNVGPVSPDLEKIFRGAPERPVASLVEHYEEHDAEHACWECLVFVASYEPRFVAGSETVLTERFDGWSPLPGDLDPDPSRAWRVDDPSLLAVYGVHTAHLWRGRVFGLREAVGERLKNHPLVTDFHDWHGSRQSQGFHGFSITVSVPWETPRTTTEMVKLPRRRKAVPQTRYVWAMQVREMLTVPEGVFGATKAEALAGFDAAVEREVRRFLPFGDSPAACDHCNGTGWVAGDA